MHLAIIFNNKKSDKPINEETNKSRLFGKDQKYQLSINLFQTLIFKCTENQLYPSLLSQLCKLLILSTLGMNDHAHLSVFRTG